MPGSLEREGGRPVCLLFGDNSVLNRSACLPSQPHPGSAFRFSANRREEFLNRSSFCSRNTQLRGVPCTHTQSCLTPLRLCTRCSSSLGHPSSPSADRLLLIRQDSTRAVASSPKFPPFLAWMRWSCWEYLQPWPNYLRTGTGSCGFIIVPKAAPGRASACGFAGPRNRKKAPVSSYTGDINRVPPLPHPSARVPKCKGTGPRCQNFFCISYLPRPRCLPICRWRMCRGRWPGRR